MEVEKVSQIPERVLIFTIATAITTVCSRKQKANCGQKKTKKPLLGTLPSYLIGLVISQIGIYEVAAYIGRTPRHPYKVELIDINEYYGVPVVGNTADTPKPPGYTPFKRSFGRVPTGSRKS